VILWAVRWYLMFPVGYRDLELMLMDRGVEVDHTTIFRWIQAYAAELEKRIRPHLRMSNDSWRVDETSYEGHHVKRDFYFGAVFIDHSSSCCCL
jgi:IS6 family transposase